ncbi:Zn-ribbon domain-containing OB-fold protein [Diaphorobacter aerolatus]|uniref:OB-fold domain-containing protein n=1 Tax=Diaphorobacter aerolatus TaxID=1288495 RepID=A0A7H0GGW7_9BURK|nr:OB-fold domain-containing protein [Diaphorobacter aerolatus]QNP47533.1 OB-fold domain-containing protein [Diaphorobacter aerolatus]
MITNTTATTTSPHKPLSAHFTQGLLAHVIRYQRCRACTHAQTLARYACQRCGAEQLVWHDASGLATVRAKTVVSRAPSDDFRALAPYTLVIVELDEGPRLMGHADADVQIGQRVNAGFFEHQGRVLLRFEPIS